MCFANSDSESELIKKMRFYGFDENRIPRIDGGNYKMSELSASMGLSSLAFAEEIISHRKKIATIYEDNLKSLGFLRFQLCKIGESNRSYFPIILENEKILLSMQKHLHSNEIETRRYFYPSLSNIELVNAKKNTPISDSISKKILCIPSHFSLDDAQLNYICDVIVKFKP